MNKKELRKIIGEEKDNYLYIKTRARIDKGFLEAWCSHIICVYKDQVTLESLNEVCFGHIWNLWHEKQVFAFQGCNVSLLSDIREVDSDPKKIELRDKMIEKLIKDLENAGYDISKIN